MQPPSHFKVKMFDHIRGKRISPINFTCQHQTEGLPRSLALFCSGATELSEADVHTIKVDVMRTRGNHPAFGPEMREQLRKMLTELCLKEKIRYMQGLHEA